MSVKSASEAARCLWLLYRPLWSRQIPSSSARNEEGAMMGPQEPQNAVRLNHMIKAKPPRLQPVCFQHCRHHRPPSLLAAAPAPVNVVSEGSGADHNGGALGESRPEASRIKADSRSTPDGDASGLVEKEWNHIRNWNGMVDLDTNPGGGGGGGNGQMEARGMGKAIARQRSHPRHPPPRMKSVPPRA